MNNTLTQFKIIKTEDQEKMEWLEVISIRNRLLSISDWTQLPDSDLDEKNVKEWKQWRHNVRNVSQATFPDKTIAKKELELLDSTKPTNINATHGVSVDECKRNLIILLRKKYTDITNSKLNIFDPSTLNEKFNESVDFLSDNNPDLTLYPILNTLARLQNKDAREIANEFINEKKKYIQNICKAEEFFNKFSYKINSATSIKKLFSIEKDINGYRY